ncbi:hypothetical protein PR202_ga11403 [Eleusine coracana subsp. coracana]|uniref:Uncharacterized protein n=1 Tax=Eleusine coracana subsp. coracana TaxID=191504 RepID=A0AAV5C9F2_ELECO|nr:hypothetical protein PR202_ga11403 [Eleusine coracana subsp. coracana]
MAGGADDVKKEAAPQLLSVSWNQDRSCFTAATTADFRVFRCRPFGEYLRRVHEDGGGFAVAEMLFRSNIFATVASSSSNNNTRDHFNVEVWDDITHKCLWQRGFPTAVRSVRVSRERIAVVVDRVVRVYPLFKPTRLLCKVETTPNPRGLCCLSCRSDETTVLACPGTVKGQVRVERLDEDTTRFIEAHSSDVACMEMTLDGTVLATASVKGTLVRVFNTVDGTCLQEVRRGRDSAEIYSIALSPDLRWLAVSSDKGTLHVFSLRIRGAGQKDAADVPSAASVSLAQPNTVPNARSSLSFMKGFLPNYFSSEWSFAQFHLPEATRYIVAFGEQNIVMILGMDASFDPVKGGEMVRKEFFRFLHDKNTPAAGTLIST